MVDGGVCERCGVRPAVAAVRRVERGRPPVFARLCEVCLNEGTRSAGEMHGGPFDDFLARLFAAAQQSRPSAVPFDVPQPVQQVDITEYFSDALRQAIRGAAQRAAEWGSAELDTDHLLWAIAGDEVATRLLARMDIDASTLRRQVEGAAERGEPQDQPPVLAPDTKRILLRAFEEARRFRATYIGPEHVLLALASDGATAGGRALARCGIGYDALRGAVLRGPTPEEHHREASTTPTLDQYGRDLTDLAREGKLDPVIGRQGEVEQTIEVLSRRTKNNPVLIGDPGVGKTAIVEGIAQRIANGDLPESLRGRRLVTLDVGSLLAGTRYRGEFEDRMKSIIDEITRHSDELLLFVDELHTIVGAGAAEGAVDAGNMLKPALARGELHVIGATTLDEYRRHIEKDAALERRFQPILVEELDVHDTVQVLFGLKDRYEAFHRVRIDDSAIHAAAELSDRYVTDRFLPDKAIDLIDQASARVRLRAGGTDTKALESRLRELTREKDQAVAAEDFERAATLKVEVDECRRQLDEAANGKPQALHVTADDVAEIVARLTGIPISQLTETERERLLHLEDHLHARVVDQEEAVRVVAESIRRSRAGLADPSRPVGSFLFLGPTGVGKTELARALAHALFGDDDLLVRFDMSEFQERHTVSRLVGAPPGYVGYEEAGQLTERIRRRPYSVVLLDEIEKAHPDVFNLLLQILDDGRLTDAQGRTVDFKNTIVVMTSNAGAERIRARPVGIGFRSASDAPFADLRDELMGVLRERFRPEFLNRIDDIVVFRPLERPQLERITRLLLDDLAERLAGRGIEIEVDDDAVGLLADHGYEPEFGARPLRRTIQRLVENELSRLVLDERIGPGERVRVTVHDGELRFDVGEGAGVAVAGSGNWEEPARELRVPTDGPSAPRPDE